MLKLSQKKRKAFLALAVAAAVLGANNAFAASVEHDKAIYESNNYGSSMRTYWQKQGVYDADKHAYTFNEDISLKPKASEQDLNYWTPIFGGLYVAGYNPVTIDMQGHRLDVAQNVDQVKVGSVNNIKAVSANGIHVTSSSLTINNVKGMNISAGGSFLSVGKVRGIYVAGTNQEGAYGDGKGLASLTINNADGWENAITFKSSQPQVENAIEVKKNTGTADLSISGMVDLYVGNDSDVITVSGGKSYYDINSTPTAYIGGGAIKAATGRAALVSGGVLSINSKLKNGELVATEGSRDVQVEGNILVKDLQEDQGVLTLGMNTDKSYFKGTIFNENGSGDAYMLLANGAQWTNESKGNYGYHGSSLKQLAGGEADAKAGNIFQKDSSSLTIDSYSGNTNIFYAHSGNGEAAENYAAGNTVIKGAAKGSVVSMVTDNTGVAMDNKDSVANVLNALAGKLTYSNYVNGESNLTGYVKIADGLTASSAALKTGDISFNKEDGNGSYSAGAVKPEVPAVKEYTQTITGFDLVDKEYADIIKDGVYKFTEDSKITNQYGMDIIEDAQIDATGKTLTLVVDHPADQGAGIKVNPGYSLNIKADTVKMELTGEDISSNGLKGINITKAGGNLTIDGNLDITANGDNNTIGVYNQGNVVVNGDVKLDIEGNNGGYQHYGATGLYATSAMGNSKGGTITVNGDVDFQGNANGIWANAGGAVVDVNGGGSIIVKEGQDMGYAAIKAENGIVNMNVLKDEGGNVTGADNNAVTIKGNLSLDTGAVNSVDIHGVKSEINLGLSTAESSLTGVVQNSFAEAGKKAGDKTFTGDANLWLQNGATWNNEVVDEIIRNPWGGEEWAGSRVTNFTGGASDAKAGNIFQKDDNSLTISNYSGNTNIFYAHTGNGEASENYAAGDTIIRGAAAGSAVSLITDNTGVAMDNKDSVANVLNALAGKLTYSNYVNGESNLTGYVKIADGLTASSAALKSGDITFNKEDGKGSYSAQAPVVPEAKTEFTTTLTGNKATDTEYADANIIADDGTYKFAKDSTITTTDKHGADIKRAATINAEGKTLTFNTNVTGSSAVHALGASSADGITVNADKLVINASSTNGRVEGINVGQGAQSKDNPMKLTINGDTEMNLKGIGYTLGLYANGNAEVTFNGNVTAMGNENSEWGLTSEEGAWGYYGCSLVYSGSNYSLQMGPKVTINGDVNAKIDGNGLFANGGHAKLTINGGGNIEINKDNEHNYYAMIAESGTTSMNVNLDENYNAVSARDNKLVLKGNVGASTGAMNANEPELYTKVNLGLATADSEWTGVAHNGFKDEGNKSGSKTFYGAINVFLQNGATWNNEEWGEAVDAFAGSHVAKFVGGVSDAKAGNIFQNDSNNLTIDNYSGNTNIFYAHEGNGEAADNYAAGDTIIRGATAGSAVSLITDNTGVAMDNKDSVANVLNALAGKLTYSNYVNGESNLTGYVKIADGLTASSAALKSGDITFNKEDGKGSYSANAPVVPEAKTEFTTTLTGDKATDTEYAGNIQDGKYVFGANTTINAAAKNAVEVKAPLTIDAGNNQLVLMAKQGDYTNATPLFKQAVDGTTSIKVGKLVIKNGSSDFNERSGMEVTKGSVDITGDVEMKLSSLSNAYGVYVKANGSKVAVHGDLKLADSEQFDSINGLYVENTADFSAKTSAITVDGKADINLHNGNAITAIRNGSTVSVGGGNIKIAKNNSKEFYALQSDGGVVNVNMNADINAAGTNTTVIEGNISAYGEKANKAWDMDVTDSIINIGLADKKSSWTGTAFAKDLGTGGLSYKGIVNLYLANGATWNNEAWGKTNAAFDGSHVTKLVGGASEAAAGNIFQKDSNNLTIDNYSGNTNIFYAHTGNGENASNYAAGDTVIKGAAAGSAVSLITDNTGISMDNDASVANALNALAGKLTYSNFVNGESNLNGSVKIADGLTSSSQTLKFDTIKFNKDTGKGYTKEESVEPGTGEKTTFTDAITGEKQGVYSAVQQEDLSYVFTEDASVTVNQMTHKEADPDWAGSYIISGAAVQNAAGVENLVIKAEDKTLKLNVALDDKTVPPDKNAGILNNRIPLRGIDNSIAGSTTSVTAGTLNINVDNTYSRKTSSGNPMIGEGSAIGIYAKSAGEKAAVEVTGNTAIKAHGYNNVYGVNANGNAEIKLHGDLTMAKDGEDWAIDNVIKGQNTTTLGESSWRTIAGINANGAGANVTVDGKTTIAAHGSGVVAADGATVNLGAADIEIKNNSDEEGYGFHALGAALGTVNVGGEGKTVTVKGNAGLFGKQGQKFASDSKESVINMKLTDAESAWTGVAYKHFTDAEKEAGLSGSMNLTVANGASWNNEKYGYVYGDSEWEKYKFTGSEIANFVGGASDAKAGNIFQKDANSLTIDNYSGNTNIFYAHTGNGEAADNYAAGDTVIKHAAEGSVVSMITDNTGISMDNQTSVNNVLNALAGKLTYSNYVNGEKNLTGYVKIADGLTASSAALKTEDITFNSENGKGGYVKPEKPVQTEFTTQLQGFAARDTEYINAGITTGDQKYTFTKDSSITVGNKDAILGVAEIPADWVTTFEKTFKGVTVDAGENTLTLKTNQRAIYANGNSKPNITSNITAGKLLITANETSAYRDAAFAVATGGATLNINADIEGTAYGTNSASYGLYAEKGSKLTVNGDITAVKENGYGIDGKTVSKNYGIRANDGTITVNGGVNMIVNGKAIAADKGTVNVNMNAELSGAADNTVILQGDVTASQGIVNLGLNTGTSKLTGAVSGNVNLYLANGASWDNTGAASSVAKLAGGVSDAKAGNIFQKDANSLTIDNYSGNTNIFYAHTGNGEAADNYAAGDTVIKHAAEGSVVSMITDNTGISMDNQTSVNNVLNTLAGKLTYSNFVNGEKNLTGYVKIADGLTASSAALKTEDITFNSENGKGGYVKPEKPVQTEFTTQLQGFAARDTEYINAGITTGDQKYTFTKDSSITVGNKDAILGVAEIPADWVTTFEKTFKGVTVDAGENTLTLKTNQRAIYANGNSKPNITSNITAGKLLITANETSAYRDAAFAVATGGATLNINADIEGTAYGTNSASYGLYAEKGSKLTVNGDITAVKENGYGIDGKTVSKNYGIRANDGTITVNGGVNMIVNGKAIAADKGTVNVNMNAELSGAADNTVILQGDVTASQGIVNLGLNTGTSKLTGAVSGNVNLYLANGASWDNTGAASSVAKLAGGASNAKAGNIFQKDANSLTIDNYSGNTNIFYAHTGNGEAADNYAAGDTIIKSAAEGSVVSMITDNTGVAMDNEYSVANVLNALAGKLTYSNFVSGEKNLTGYVKIADGLTASSKAMQTGNISFSTENGKGSLESGSMTPGITYPETQKPGSNKLNQGISGNAKDDYQYKQDGILKADGSYVFTQDPTVIEVKEGAAVNASASDIVIDTTKAKLELKGAEAGINADGANVNIKGNTNISGATGVNAEGGNVTLTGSTVINGTDAAINAAEGSNVTVDGNNGAITVNGSINADGGNITVDSGKATSVIKGDINAANGGSVAINLTEKSSTLNGGYNVDGTSSIEMNLANGATWHLTDGEEAAGMSLLRMAKGAATAGLTINGGKTEAEKGFLDMTKRTKTLDIAHYSGWETIVYEHKNAGADVADYTGGDTVIAKADKGSGVILSTDGSGITMTDKNAVEATLKALAQKVTYKDHEANGANLTGKVQIAEGLTSSSASKNLGTIHWDENGKGQYDLDSVNWNQIIEGDYETFVMKGVRSAATTSLHTWRDNMQDTYTGADLADEDGMFAKALGGKTSSDVKGLKDSNTYYGVQVGYDKAAANGWHTGVAFDYRNGDSNYLLGGKGDNQMYSLGVYGVKNFENNAFFRVAAKVGRVENEYDVYNEIRSLKLHGDYKANAYGLTMEYGKTFGDEEAYFTPKAQLTWSQVGSKDYTAHTANATMQVAQDSYSSFVGRLGFEAGVKSEKGRLYAGLFAAHEFNGDISASYFANDGNRKHTSFDGEETWMEMKLGGTYDFSNNAHLYADISKDFNGNFERKWKLNAGIRFEF